MFSVGLSCFLGSYETVHLCSVQFICIPVLMQLPTCIISNHSTMVHKNSYIRLSRYTIPARGHPNPNTERTEFYSQILRNGNNHPDGKQSTQQLNKCNLILQDIIYVTTGIHTNCTEHKCAISYEPRKQLSPTENITNNCLHYPLSNQTSNVSTVDRITYAHPCQNIKITLHFTV